MRCLAHFFFQRAAKNEEKEINVYCVINFMIAIFGKTRYTKKYRAKRGISGALYSQSATARPNSHSRWFDFEACPMRGVLTLRSCATGTSEPCQIRKEAAVS